MDKKTITDLTQFKKRVSKNYPIDKLILFGSQASGKAGPNSDIDLLIVSPKFKNLDFLERGVKMYSYWNLKKPVDFLCYSPTEFVKLSKRMTLVSEAVKEGIEI